MSFRQALLKRGFSLGHRFQSRSLTVQSLSARTYNSVSPSRKWATRVAYTTAGIGTIWLIDNQFNASSLARNLRTVSTVRSESAISIEFMRVLISLNA